MFFFITINESNITIKYYCLVFESLELNEFSIFYYILLVSCDVQVSSKTVGSCHCCCGY